ncbi:outer membrane protein assembly factor BamD [Aridibaculum aurantiacum]|uniref:outer membrane protein assembly factor BamD n=1 Tax=Aridibaculum aurantiacum TaxID=2810307 RepID=UPI001A9684C0|nr:outer membrane protein assembly factor BamD [Aridibaculum aurantiacum]
MNRNLLLLACIILLSSCASQLTKVMKSTDPDYKLKMGEKYFAEKKYSNAQVVFEDLFPVLKGTAKFEDLYYKYAYTAYHLKDYMNAENLFKTFVETFPTSPKAEDADFMRAYSFYKQSPKPELDQTNTLKAMGQMQVFINTHPTSPRIHEATAIIDESRQKLEIKDSKNAELYYNMGFYKSAAIAYNSIIDNFPDTDKGDEYKLMVIKSYFLYAANSIEEKQAERYDKVVTECLEFVDRFPESTLTKTVEDYRQQSLNKINNKNEQAKKAA